MLRCRSCPEAMVRPARVSDRVEYVSGEADMVGEAAAGRAVLITAAAPSQQEQHRARVRRYLFIMSFRVPALLLAAWAYGEFGPLMAIIIMAVSVPLPWVAVLIANDRPPRRKDEPSRYSGAERARRALERPGRDVIDS